MLTKLLSGLRNWGSLAFAPVLGGCAGTSLPDMAANHRGIHADGYFTAPVLQSRFPEEWANIPLNAEGDPVPHLGLALAGGGTKAAGFSMGVLQGLSETGILPRVDVISSVSGGGYAAYWYFSRLSERAVAADAREERLRLSAEFSDCMSNKYPVTISVLSSAAMVPCPRGLESPDGKMRNNLTNYDVTRDVDPFPYQNYIRGYQDLFSSGQTIAGGYTFSYEPEREDHTRITRDAVALATTSAFATVVNLVPNILFDWEVQLSPSRYSYNNGIRRTFGAYPTLCDRLRPETCGQDGIEFRAEGALSGQPDEGLSFRSLQAMYEKNQAPLWIINTTSGEDRTPWDMGGPRPPGLTVFEFTPYRSGSGIYGYRRGQLGNLSPFRATAASAAFFDSQQKVELSPAQRMVTAALMRIFTFDWGISIVNPAVGGARGGDLSSESWQTTSEAHFRIAFHRILPWPLYYFHYFSAAPDSAYIHLSDGGQSENLGAYSLVRRGTDTIIISDHAFDRSGTLEDVCRFRRSLQDEHTNVEGQAVTTKRIAYDLYIPGLPGLDDVCSDKDAAAYDVFRWKHPVLVGCIAPIAGPEASPESVCLQLTGRTNWRRSPADGTYWARVIIVKPVIGGQALTDGLNTVMESCRPGQNRKDCWHKLSESCAEHHDIPQGVIEPVPCEVLGFAVRNFFAASGRARSDNCPHFPQFNTVTMTLSSSPWMYGALRELGRYYARIASRLFVQGSREIQEERFNSLLISQARDPLNTKQARRSVFNAAKAESSGEDQSCPAFPLEATTRSDVVSTR